MKLNQSSIVNDKNEWIQKGYALPQYDRGVITKNSIENPEWVHFGAGNIFRAFQADIAQDMLNKGLMNTGICVVEGFDYEIIEKAYRPYDNNSILVTLKSDGTIEKKVIGSITESLILDSENETEYSRLKEVFSKDSLKLVTFTITEKGYSLVDSDNNILPMVKKDIEEGPQKPGSYMGKVTSLLYTRYLSGKKKIAFVSTDNCSHNGDKLHDAVAAYAKGWVDNGKAEKGFLDYISDENYVSFPWSMIDKITPRPDASVQDTLSKDMIEGLEPVITSKNTYVAPFVNAEETGYLVIEDKFPNGRPKLEEAGVIFTDKETVDKVERMKVCTCLNPLHTALAIYGCLLGYTKISDEMKDDDLRRLIEIIGYKEGLPVVTDPGVLNPKEFIDTVLQVRLPNPYMPDAPQRIATDTSQKLPIRFGVTISNYLNRGLDIADLKLIPLVLAGYLRYLMALDDNGETFTLSSDPMLDTICPLLNGISLSMDLNSADVKDEIFKKIDSILLNEKIFGVDLAKAGLLPLIKNYFLELINGVGAVRNTLHKYVSVN